MQCIKWAISDIKRNKMYVSLFVVSFSISLLLLSMVFSQFEVSYHNLKVINSLEKHTITNVNISYLESEKIQYSNVDSMLKEANISSAYSVINRVSNTYQDISYLYVIGDINALNKGVRKPHIKSDDVMLGANINSENNANKIKEELYGVSIKHSFPKNTMIITQYGLTTKLDDYVVIFKDFKDIGVLDFSTDEVFSNMLLVDCSDTQLNHLEKLINETDGMHAQMNNFITSSKSIQQDNYASSIFFIILFGCLLCLFLVCMIVNNNILVDMKIKEYAIHIIYGATNKVIYMRVMVYNFIIISSGLLLYFMSNAYLNFIDVIPYRFVFYLSISIWIILSLFPLLKIKRRNLFANIRGDFI